MVETSLSIQKIRQLLRESDSVLDKHLEEGLSVEAVTPAELKAMGMGLVLRYGFHPTPFGECFLALTSRGICSLGFVEKGDREHVLAELKKAWKGAAIVEDPEAGRGVIEQIFDTDSSRGVEPIKILLCGTDFQLKVWRALLRIPPGEVVSYSALAKAVGHPGATRSVGTAVGRNPIAYLIPCHRVVRASGEIGGYRWGVARKEAMLAREAGSGWLTAT